MEANLEALLTGGVDGGVVVRVLGFYRSSLSPQFYHNTGLTVVPGVDFTFDAEVSDGREKVRFCVHCAERPMHAYFYPALFLSSSFFSFSLFL